MTAEQRVPQVTSADVERVVKRDFAPAETAAVWALLAEVGREARGAGADRVRLAALKLAGGDLAALRREVESAELDPRDVLGPAEYPRALRLDFGGRGRLGPEELQALYDADWAEYAAWLGRT